MRYEDFDVLLFPAGEDVGHAPIREFKTICISERTTPNGAAIPLMTCFVPSLPANHPFQISVHSWTQTKPKLGPLPEGNGVREVWQVRVVVDGTIVSLSHLPVEAQWPQIICE